MEDCTVELLTSGVVTVHVRGRDKRLESEISAALSHTQKKKSDVGLGPSLRITMGISTMGRDVIHCHIYAYSAPYHGDIIQIVKLIFDATKGTFGFR